MIIVHISNTCKIMLFQVPISIYRYIDVCYNIIILKIVMALKEWHIFRILIA